MEGGLTLLLPDLACILGQGYHDLMAVSYTINLLKGSTRHIGRPHHRMLLGEKEGLAWNTRLLYKFQIYVKLFSPKSLREQCVLKKL